MPKFEVVVSEVSYHTFAVEASTMDEAWDNAKGLWDTVPHETEIQIADFWEVKE